MNLRFRSLLCLLSLLSLQAHGQESGGQETGDIAESESRFLFINMLEFLGEFETKEGDWISPGILADDTFADLDSGDGENSGQGSSRSRQQNVLSAAGDED